MGASGNVEDNSVTLMLGNVDSSTMPKLNGVLTVGFS